MKYENDEKVEMLKQYDNTLFDNWTGYCSLYLEEVYIKEALNVNLSLQEHVEAIRYVKSLDSLDAYEGFSKYERYKEYIIMRDELKNIETFPMTPYDPPVMVWTSDYIRAKVLLDYIRNKDDFESKMREVYEKKIPQEVVLFQDEHYKIVAPNKIEELFAANSMVWAYLTYILSDISWIFWVKNVETEEIVATIEVNQSKELDFPGMDIFWGEISEEVYELLIKYFKGKKYDVTRAISKWEMIHKYRQSDKE